MTIRVIAKFLGPYMPEKKIRIANCTISKTFEYLELDDDRPEIPVRSKSSEFHILAHGVRNFIQYPQSIISARTFESEYYITTDVSGVSIYDAVTEANQRFSKIEIALSLVAKNHPVLVNNRRIKYGDACYDFEIIAALEKRGKRFLRLKLPRPLINGRNFFPKRFPKGFISKTKGFLEPNDPVLSKCLIYFQRATAMRHSGVYDELVVVLNFVKCIELICTVMGRLDHFGLTKKEYRELGMKNVIGRASKLLKVRRTTVSSARRAWDVRNRGDIAHKNEYYNPYSPLSSLTLVNVADLESICAEYIRKYRAFLEKNPLFRYELKY